MWGGCRKDNPAGNNGLIGPESENTVYAHIKISNSDKNTSRAAGVNDNDFEDGDKDENTVKNMLIVFYEENGEVVGYYSDQEWTQTPDSDKDDDTESRLQWKEAEVVPIKLLRPGEPFYAIAFLNHDMTDEELTGKTMSEVSTIVKDTFCYHVDNTDYFLMTNAGYFDSGDDYCIATKLEGSVFQTPEEARNSPAITIYVERAAARVDLKIKNDAVQKYQVFYAGTEYELQFMPEHWGLTATEKENYLLKNMKENLSRYGGEDYPKGFSEWINYERHRTYWAETPNYASYKYPGSGAATEDASLNYIGYDELKSSTITVGAAEYARKYTFEHTFDAEDFKNAANPYTVPTSIVIGGEYEAVKKADGATRLDFRGGGFYLRTIANTKQIYLEKNTDGKNDLFEAYLNEQNVIYTKDAVGAGAKQTYTPVRYGPGLEDDFEVKNTNKSYSANGAEAESSNAYTLQLKDAAVGKYYLCTYDPEGDRYEYSAIGDDAALAKANVQIQKNVGSAFMCSGGRSFFYIPVLHFITSESYPGSGNGGAEYTGSLATDNDGKVINKTGEFGIVRNHIYRLTIEKIDGLGFGEPGDSGFKPLPDVDEDEQWYLHAKLEILSWHVIEFGFDLKQ